MQNYTKQFLNVEKFANFVLVVQIYANYVLNIIIGKLLKMTLLTPFNETFLQSSQRVFLLLWQV